ncbi:translation machinery-associated protein 20 [Coniosporium tulheliwenetii]|uniref:Translation machinery-associated protein 20 n=1 Tax=Coniosporium tulheliwenetii TaxID=3383036 RepID=A0ACC2ZK56_9PEZI|nr:translation machinery-associated protein 20 [Cladosporium sp. JES 115]
MFKKDITPGAKSKVKSSVQRAIRTKITETYPLLVPHIDEILPKKEQLDLTRPRFPLRPRLDPLFFQHMDDPLLPHLTLVHKYPTCFPLLRIDRGAIRFVLSGASLMAPGLTSPGGRLPKQNDKDGVGPEEYRYGNEELEEGEVVVVEAEGKENACLIGVLRMGTKEMKEKKKGVVIEGGIIWGMGYGRWGWIEGVGGVFCWVAPRRVLSSGRGGYRTE